MFFILARKELVLEEPTYAYLKEMFADVPAIGEATDNKKAPRKTGKVQMLKKRNPKQGKNVASDDDSSESSSEITVSDDYDEISEERDQVNKKQKDEQELRKFVDGF